MKTKKPSKKQMSWEIEFDKKFSVFDGWQKIIRHVTFSSWIKEFIHSLLLSEREKLIKEIEGMKKDKRFPYQALEFGDCPYCGCEINREWINDKLKEVGDEFLSDVLERLK